MSSPRNIVSTVDDPERLRLLLELGQAFAELAPIDELLTRVSERVREVLHAESCAVLLLDPDRDELYFPVNSDVEPDVERRFHVIRFPADRGIAGWVLRHGEPTIVHDVSRDARFYAGVDRESGVQTRNLLYAPLRSRRGTIGVIGVRNRIGGPFAEPDLALLEALAASVAIAIENAWLYDEVKNAAERLRVQVGALRRDLVRHERFGEIVGTGQAMAEVFRLMESAAASSIPVLIEGETGTGKELVARAIHRESARSREVFLAVNCAALPEALLESELFGHRRGAFTGALQDRRGLFEAADGGTLFLDEVGEMTPAMQAKLLRVLQEGEVVPVGDTRPRKVDVRVLSATNRDLEAAAAAGRFRDDLYYRLSTFPIRLPPLRERCEDVPLLVERVLDEVAVRQGKRVPGIDPAALEALVGWRWPGNVRELRNEIERAVAIAADGETLRPAHLSAKLREARPDARAGGIVAQTLASSAAGGADGLRLGKASFEARYIAEVLRQHDGNVTHTARALGMSRVTLYKKLRGYGLRSAD